MIYTSDNQVYEDATAHALEMPKDLSSTASRMPRQSLTEPAGEFKSQEGTNTPKTLYIIRHGSTDMNGEGNVSADRIRGWTDIPLNDEGRQDAEKAGQKLAGMEAPTVMHHSDLDRASETADIIGKHIDVPTQASRALRPWDLGTLTGKATKEAIPEIEDYVKNKPDQAVPKGESFNEFKERAFKGIHAALDSGDSPVAIVTHHRLERLLEAWDKKGQPADHSIDLDTFTQKGDPPGGIKTMKIAMNDNAPKGEMNLPNITGGLSPPPKPANDNDSRKPFKMTNEEWDQLDESDREFIKRLGYVPMNLKAVQNFPKSTNIINRNTIEGFLKEQEFDKNRQEPEESEDTLNIGLKNVQDRIDKGALATMSRQKLKEELEKRIIVPSERSSLRDFNDVERRVNEFQNYKKRLNN